MVELGVVSLDEGLDGLLDEITVELSLTELAEHLRLVDTLGELTCTLNVGDVVDEDLDGGHVVVELLEDGEGLLKQTRSDGNIGNIRGVVVVEAVDVVHNACAVSLDGGQDEQVLEVAVASELVTLNDDLLEQLDQLVGEICSHESLDGGRHLLRVLRFGKGGLDDLVNNAALELVGVVEDVGPELLVLTLDKVAGLVLEETVLVGDLNQLVVAETTLVGDKGKVRVAFLTVFTNHLGVVELVLGEELLGVLVGVNVDLSNGVVGGGLDVALGDAGLQPWK